MKSFKQYLTESNTVLLSWSSTNWWVHFYKESEHGEAIISSGEIKPGEDGIVWAIKQGRGYNESQIETHWETGEKVSRTGAIVFVPYKIPDVDDLMNLSAWKQTVEFPVGYMISFELGKSICDDKNIDKIKFLKAYEE